MKLILARSSLGVLLVIAACAEDDPDGDPAQEFTRGLQYAVQATPQVTGLPAGVSTGPQPVALPGDSAPLVVVPGDDLNLAIGWQGGTIGAVNMSCSPEQYTAIPVPGAGNQTEGVVQIPATLASNVCNSLDALCYPIQCSQQLVSTGGSVSIPRVAQIILDCGNTGCGATGSGTVELGDPCALTQECVPGSVCFNRFCVGAGSLRISLAFTVDSDFDLHVLTPGNSEIYYGEKTADGGTLDVDQCVDTCGMDAHAENVVFGTALAGQYEVWVENYDGRAEGGFSVQVAGDANQTFTGSLPALDGAESEHFLFTL